MSSIRELDRARIGWWAGAAMLSVALGFVIYSFVGTFVFGIFIYYATRPIYRHLRNHVRPASLAAMIALTTIALPAILLAAYTIAVGLQEFSIFVESRAWELGQIEPYVQPYLNVSTIVSDPESFLDQPNTVEVIRQTLSSATMYLGFIGTAALHLFVMVTIAFYLLRDDHRLRAWFYRRFSDGNGVLETYATHVDRDFSNIFFGNILNAVLTAIIGGISYAILNYVAPPGTGIPYATLLGLLTGVASLIPVVGMKLVYFPVAAYLGVQTIGSPELLWFPLTFVVVSFVIVDVIPDLVLRPYVSGRGLHLGMVMLAYIFGPLIFGWYGIFLGPMLLVLIVHFVRLVLPELLAGRPVEPEVLDREIRMGEEYRERAMAEKADAASADRDDGVSSDRAGSESDDSEEAEHVDPDDRPADRDGNAEGADGDAAGT